MAYAEGQLNGSADYRVYFNIDYSGVQDWNGNSSRFDWQVYLQNPNRWGSWSGGTQAWSATVGGVVTNGNFTLPQSEGGTVTRLIGSGSTWIGHASNGTRPGFESSAYIATNHGSIGSGSSGGAWVDAPRIPIKPASPGQPSVSNLAPTSMKLSWTGTPDNGGASIDQYLLRTHTNANVEAAGYKDYPLSGSTLSHTVTGLTPGTQYYAAVYAHNTRGFSPKSATSAVKTLSGAYVRRGSSWRPTELLVRKGSAWVTGETFVRKGSAWVPAS